MLERVLICIAAVFVFMCLGFAIAHWRKNNGLVDVAWGLGFVLITWLSLWQSEAIHWQRILITGAVSLWGLRLAYFLAKRNIGKSEDFRYHQWRKEWGKWAVVRSFLQVFMLQGFIMLIIATPIMLLSDDTKLMWDWQWMAHIGGAIFLIGFLTEAIADYQKSKYRKHKTRDDDFVKTGLWRYSRHPNYFGELILWVGIWIMSLPHLWFVTVVSPLLLGYLLLRVSGIPMLEKKYDNNPEYQQYKARTSAFIPWFPKN